MKVKFALITPKAPHGLINNNLPLLPYDSRFAIVYSTPEAYNIHILNKL